MHTLQSTVYSCACPFHFHLLFTPFRMHISSYRLIHPHTLASSRCGLTQRSTWRVTVEREGHWEMFLATCRASSLRAASTSSSLAAHMWPDFRDKRGGLRPREGKEGKHIETWVERTHLLLTTFYPHVFYITQQASTMELTGEEKNNDHNERQRVIWWVNGNEVCTKTHTVTNHGNMWTAKAKTYEIHKGRLCLLS